MLGSVTLSDRILLSICFVSLTGILEYMLVMSSEANLEEGVSGVCFNSCINCVEFLMLNVNGSGVSCWTFWANIFANL